MKLATGTVVGGKVVVEGEALAEGSTVTVVVPDPEEGFDLSGEDEAELLESLAEIQRGEFLIPDELFAKLRRIG